MMREISALLITETIARMCIDANCVLTDDVREAVRRAVLVEESPIGRELLQSMEENSALAEKNFVPVCQDTGMAVVFAEVGQEVHIVGGSFEEAVDRGVANGYTEGYLRLSVVGDPLKTRVNTENNAPAVLYTRLVAGDRIKLTLAPKGFGSENMSALIMLTPAATRETVIQAAVDAVAKAGSNPCPPVVIGVGLGGTADKAAQLAKFALTRRLDERHPDPFYAQMEEDILCRANMLGIGPQGLGGRVTALACAIETYPTHIAGLPMAVCLGCHVNRHRQEVL